MRTPAAMRTTSIARTTWLLLALVPAPSAAFGQSLAPPASSSASPASGLLSWPTVADDADPLASSAWQRNARAVHAAPQAQPARPDRFDEFVRASVRSPLFYVQAAGGGVLDQIGHFPDEWHGAAGFAKRNAARAGQAFVGDAIGHATAAVLRHRVAYDACTCTGFARVTHALSRAAVSVKSDGSGFAPNWSLWSSKFAAAGLANAWYPATYKLAESLSQGAGGIAGSAGLNLVREFAPELLRIAHLK